MSEYFSFYGEREGILERVRAYLQERGGIAHRAFIASGTGIPYGPLCRAINHDRGQTMTVDGRSGEVRLNGARAARRAEWEKRDNDKGY